mgnify:CR=1 FL=1
MFCYQCEQTAKGTGCTVQGVCGKQPDVAALQDLLLYVLMGNVLECYRCHAQYRGLPSLAGDLSGRRTGFVLFVAWDDSCGRTV